MSRWSRRGSSIGGTIRTDTAAALVAAEAATITFSPDGLFDIQVDVGTDDANGVVVDGGTIARNSAAPTAPAITMPIWSRWRRTTR